MEMETQNKVRELVSESAKHMCKISESLVFFAGNFDALEGMRRISDSFELYAKSLEALSDAKTILDDELRAAQQKAKGG